jgi:hypothetical protein
MKNTASIAEVAALLGFPIRFDQIGFTTSTHKVTIHINIDGDLMVNKKAKQWNFSSEVRRGRPKDSYAINPSVAYLKGLTK